jgi:hypothetical protein
MSDDPQFPPDHVDFYMLSDALISMDSMAVDIETPEQMNAFIDKHIDGPSLVYVAEQRMNALASSMPFPQNLMVMQIRDVVAGIWQDGFIAAQLYQERKANGLMTVPDTLEGLDGL